MNFHRYLTTADSTRKYINKEVDSNEIYTHALEQPGLTNHVCTLMLMELLWEKQNRPYYKVHPQIIPTFSKFDFTKVSSNAFKIPIPYHAVALHFAESPYLSIDDTHYVRNVLVARSVLENIKFNLGKDKYDITLQEEDILYESDDTFRIAMWFDIGEQFRGMPIKTYRLLEATKSSDLKQSIEEAKGFIDADMEVFIPELFVRKLWNVVAMSCMLACGKIMTVPNLITPDILNRYRTEYEKADDKRKEEIIELTKNDKRDSKNGFDIGKDFIEGEPLYFNI